MHDSELVPGLDPADDPRHAARRRPGRTGRAVAVGPVAVGNVAVGNVAFGNVAVRIVAVAAAVAVGTAMVLLGAVSSSTAVPVRAPARTATRPAVTKLLVVVMENHSLSEMKAGMPFTWNLARNYGYATDYHAIRHPSLPNYLAVAGGSTHGVTDDRPPAAHPLHGSSVFGQALWAGRTTTVYAEGMPSACSLVNGGDHYAVRHNPWAYFVDERSGCRSHDVPYGRFAGDVSHGRLPRVGMVVPNTCHDAHDCSLATADAWFRALMRTVIAGPDWRSGRLAVVLTADEDDLHSGNRVLTVVVHPSVRHRVATGPLTHYSLTRLYDRVAGLPLLGAARTAPSIATAFGLRLS